MAEPYVAVRDEFDALAIARAYFPMWTDWGVEDESIAVHSLGLSYLTTIGQQAGFACCSECPVMGGNVRADSVWWDKGTRDPVALFEFERHKDGSELVGKVQNLLHAYHSLQGRPALLGLVFWTKNFYPLGDEGVRDLWSIFERGFLTEDRRWTPPAPTRLLHVFECLHEDAGPGRHMLKKITERRRR
jgi:hypothetical protein